MTLTITVESPTGPDGRALIDASQAALLAVFGPDEIFTLSAEELGATPGMTFYVARGGSGAVGCVASLDCGAYAEVKRLFVTDAGRGQGVARALMARLEDDARRGGKPWVRLETGPQLVAATALYRSLGYHETGPFGDYPEHPASLFMGRQLATGQSRAG